MPSQGLPDGFHIKALSSGKVEFRLVSAGKEKAFLQRHANSLSFLISGRRLRMFRIIRVGPGIVPSNYGPVGKCIYCGAKVYSIEPGIRTEPFGAEHIIPEGIGGNLELPESSCQKCEDTTVRLVEGDALGRTLKALRVHLKLKKPGSGPHPSVLPLTAQVDGRDTTIPDVPVDDYPIAFMLPIYWPPEFTAVATSFGKAMRGALVANIKVDMKTLWRKYQITGFASAYWDNGMLCRMLAKIAHSLAIAELGEGTFHPLLLKLICDGDSAGMSLVGCAPEWEKIRRSSALHTIGLGYQRHRDKTFVVASVRLFANYESPVYRIVIGESLEGPVARSTRVFSNIFSRILGRRNSRYRA